MKKSFKFLNYSLIGICMLLMLTFSCKKDDVNNNEVKDIDGNIYNTVTIGTQVWMVENLKTMRYNDGTPIPNISNQTEWTGLSSAAYCWYNNDVSNKNLYGALYNWYSVNTGKLAPVGWHIPSDEEWTILINFLDGDSIAGGKLKEEGTAHWLVPNTGATNETHFTALPGGSRYGFNGLFGRGTGEGSYAGAWWSKTDGPYNNEMAWVRTMSDNTASVNRGVSPKVDGNSIRCLRN